MLRPLSISSAVLVVIVLLAPPAAAAPDTTITSGPQGTVNVAAATFEFTSSSHNATFECTVDTAPYTECTSPITYSDLAEGAHRFAVRSSDGTGADPSPATRSWTVNVTRGDADGDGTPDAADRCPGTRPGVTELKPGCSPLQVAVGLNDFSAAAREDISGAQNGVRAVEGASDDGVLTRLSHARTELQNALNLVGAGRVCDGSAAAGTANDDLSRALSLIEDFVTTERGALERQTGGHADSDDRQIRWIDLGLLRQDVDRAQQSINDFDTLLGRLCAGTTEDAGSRGEIVHVDDAGGVIELDNGEVWSFPQARLPGSIYEGAVGDVSGTLVGAKEGMATDIAMEPGPQTAKLKQRCLRFRIVPLQPFSPPLPSAGPYTKHSPSAYRFEDVLRLERGMRLGVESTGQCEDAEPDPGYTYTHQTLSISLNWIKPGSNAIVIKTLAVDLDPSDAPVALPSDLPLGKAATLTVREKHQQCLFVGLGNKDCSEPVTAFTDKHELKQYETRSQCNVDYEDNDVELDDDNPLDYTTTAVEPLSLLNRGLWATVDVDSFAFAARGYPPGGAPDVVTRKVGQPFSIYNHDFFTDHDLYAEEQTGVDHAGGLMWPRLKGQRNGHSFWYLCRLPQLNRDLVTKCNPGPNCYYLLPWENGKMFKMGQGNNGDFTHKGAQKYAFDFGMGLDEEIYATRGGTVTFVDESLTLNCNTNNGDEWCPGNELGIKHEDGTYSRYVHMPQNGVNVTVGEDVNRGDLLGQIGITGNSTGPHLHYEARQEGYAGGGASIMIRFEVRKGLTLKLKTCYIPAQGDFLTSTNDH